MELKEFFESKAFTKVLFIVGILVIVFVIFQAGVFVGYHKASFTYRSGENYMMMFRNSDRVGGPFGDRFPEAHGAIGKILEINLPTLVLQEPDGDEKVVSIVSDTSIRSGYENLTSKDLKVGQYVVAIGSPNDKLQVEAKLIRLLPPPPGDTEATTTAN